LHWEAPNEVAVKVDNAFSDSMLPRDKSSDWAHDGGIYRPVRLLNPHRLCSFASNSLQQNPGKDVSQIMDFIEWNEYYQTWYGGTKEDLRRNLDEIHRAFPDKPIVISEYRYCACTPDRPEDDAKRVDVLVGHDRVFRDTDYVAGLIFFDYNDYRTHVGDKGVSLQGSACTV